jgi:hypothetical protein
MQCFAPVRQKGPGGPLERLPEALAPFKRGIAREISTDKDLCTGLGHTEAIAAIEHFLEGCDPDSMPGHDPA